MVVSGRWNIIPQLAVYTTYIPLIVLAFWGGKNATYHLLWEPETTIDLRSSGGIFFPKLQRPHGAVGNKTWVHPPPNNSDHQEYHLSFARAIPT